jgi:hypothetical protein
MGKKGKLKHLKNLNKELTKSKEWKRFVRLKIAELIEEAQNKMLKKFDNHAVTKEILGGVSAKNISNTLGGYSNLFSYIGFNSGDTPIKDLRDVLSEFSIRLYTRKDRVTIAIVIPTEKQIYSKTPLPWATGRSWAKSIEQGLSNFGLYIARDGSGRSEGGIQTKNKIRSSSFNAMSYLTPILEEYYKEIKNIKNKRR